jgi:hypothetical protein
MGAVGPQGSTGATGPQGPAGPVGMIWQGDWSNSSVYAANDAVAYGGSSYISLRRNAGSQPDVNTSDWALLAVKGTDGAVGATGAQGPAGPTGPQGPQGATGLQGPIGPAGPLGPSGATGPQGPQGPTGPAGPTGPTGATGATGAAGAAGQNNVNWQGTWSNLSTYAINDAVFYNGSSYRSLTASNLNHQPDITPVSWALFASGGGTGNATLTFGGNLSGTTTGATGYIFQSSGASVSATSRSIGVLGRAAGGLSGAIPVASAVPSGVGLTANFTMGVMGNCNSGNVGVLGLAGAQTSVGVWGHNDSNGASNWNVGVIGTSNGTNNFATGVYGQGSRGVSGLSALLAKGSDVTQANRVQGGAIYGETSNADGNAGFFKGRVVIENTTAGGSSTAAKDPFIVWTNSGASGFNSSGVLFTPSDRNVKENFVAIDDADVLKKVIDLPVTLWNFKCDDKSILHMGPMAQDFHAAFGLNGDKDKVITTLDIAGVTVAAVQGLNHKLEKELAARDTTISTLSSTVAAQSAELSDLKSRMTSLETLARQGGLSVGQSAGLGLVVSLPLLGFAILRRRGEKPATSSNTEVKA